MYKVRKTMEISASHSLHFSKAGVDEPRPRQSQRAAALQPQHREPRPLDLRTGAEMLPRRCPRMRGKRGELRGVIILGVKEHDGIFEPNNLSDESIDKLQKDFWNGVRNKNTVNICLLQQKDVEVGCSETRTTARTLYPGCVQRYIPQKL